MSELRIHVNRKRWILGGLAFLTLICAVWAEQLTCAICGKPITGHFYYLVDKVTGLTNNVCTDCAQLDKCSVCGLPVKDGAVRLPDGRILCARDAKDAVMSEDDAKDVCRQTKDDIDRLFSRFMTFPDSSVEISIMDKFHMEDLFSAPEFHSDNGSVGGATASHLMPDGRYHHSIDLLSCMSRSRLMAVCAHEYTHTWINENVKQARRTTIDRDTIEGLCELVAYKYMESRQDSAEMTSIRRNLYTRGQIDAMIAADSQYGFNAVLEWMQNGADSRLDLNNLDRIRAVQDTPYTPAKPAATIWKVEPTPPPTPVPDTLVLKGISGTAQDRFALINNATFETMEKGPVRVGQTNVVIRCLEIRDDSVIIQVVGSNEKKQLFLGGSDTKEWARHMEIRDPVFVLPGGSDEKKQPAK